MSVNKVVCALALFILAGCVRPASTAPATTPNQTDLIRVVGVQVTQGTGVYVTGESNLPEGACVRTSLIEDNTPVSWWPEDVCIESSTGQWEILVPLARRGAPDALREDAQYEIQAWWPDNEAGSTTRFPFDLQGPPAGE